MDAKEIATWLEVEYWENAAYPSIQDVMKKTGLNEIQLDILKEIMDKQLATRGMPPVEWAKPQKVPKDPDPEFVAAVALVLDTLDKRATSVKLKALGMSTRRFQVLMADPVNQKYYKSRLNKVYKGGEDTARLGLLKNMENGDLQSIKLYMEHTKMYNPNEQIILNLQVIIARLMEVLAKHVDSNTLLRVGDEFTMIMETTSNEILPKELTA